VVLVGDVVAIDEAAGIVAVQFPGGKLHHVPLGRVCASEADAVELAAAPVRARMERNEREAREASAERTGQTAFKMRKVA
jgi:hypothetical protein